MKNFILIMGIVLILFSCSTSRNTIDQSFDNALIGRNEMAIYKLLGAPTRIESASDGGKIFIYEAYSKGMYLTPNKSKITYNAQTDPAGNIKGWTFTSNVNTATNDPEYTIYQQNQSYLKVFIDKQGICTRYEQALPKEQLEIYHERFKHFSPEIK